jgi:thymidylate synthase
MVFKFTISENIMNHFGKKIVAHSIVDGWTSYVSSVFNNSTMGMDDDQQIREQFGVSIYFSPDADFDSIHPLMDMARQTQYVRKILSTKIDKELGGSYGYRIFVNPYGNQFETAVEQLIKRPESKSVIINLLHPLEWERKIQPNIKRMACLTHIQALIRDGQLHFFAQFRSQNVWNSHGNFKGLYELQHMMLARLEERGLKVNRGGLTVDITAAHIYEFDFKVAERLLC